MRENMVYQFNSQKKMIEFFSEEMAQYYRTVLELWEALSTDEDVKLKLERRRNSLEPLIIRDSVAERIATILNNPPDREYSKKIIFGIRSKKYISIKCDSDFYNHIAIYMAPDEEINVDFKVMAPKNVEYIIDRTKNTVIKKVYPIN